MASTGPIVQSSAVDKIEDADRVEKPSQSYTDMSALWPMMRSLMAGTAGMRAQKQTYLPQETGESDVEYDKRLARSFLFNAFRRTVSNIVGKVFAKPLVLGEDVPSKVEGWTENVDLAGRNLDTFAADLLLDGLQTGISHVLVDMQRSLRPDVQGLQRPVTIAEERAAGTRPYFVHIKAENLIGWRSENIKGVQTLTQIRIKETVTEPDGEFGEKKVERIRVLWRDRFEVYEKNGDSQYDLIDEGVVTLGKIPLATFYANRTGFMLAEPPLQDLADLNVAHWQSASDQRHILHFARVPVIFRAGFGEKEGGVQEFGPNRMFTAKDPNAKMAVVEHTGAAIGSGRIDLQDIEDRMRVMGLELFLSRPGNVTATGRMIDANEVNSTVKMWALAEKDALEAALGFMAEWAGEAEDSGGSITINTDYGISLRDSADIQGLIQARMAGEISRETFWAEMKRRGVLADDFDADDEADRIAAEPPALGLVPPDDGAGEGEDDMPGDDGMMRENRMQGGGGGG